MDVFFTADLHLDHYNIIKHCNRKFGGLDEMNTTIVNNINNVCNQKDILYIMGDFAYRNHRYWINQLNCKVILVKGNHDKMNQLSYNQFTEVHDILFRKIGKYYYHLCHYAMKNWRNKIYNAVHLYGHTHGRVCEFEDELSLDIGVDVWNYKPVSLNLIEYIIDNRLKIKKEFTQEMKSKLELNVLYLQERNKEYVINYDKQ